MHPPGSSFRASTFSSTAPLPPSRPFLLAASGTRNKNFKGTFEPFSYVSAGPSQQLSNDSSLAAIRLRSVSAQGAPTNVHRGVTSMRAAHTEQGVGRCTAPAHGCTLSGSSDSSSSWHPAPYTHGSLLRVTENFREGRGLGLQGKQQHDARVKALHGDRASFTFGAHEHPALFDQAVRGLTRDGEVDAGAAIAAIQAQTRVPHRAPFKSGGAAKGVGAERGFVGGHGPFPYHYSDFGLSEASLRETKIASNSSTGFRQRCAHQIHHAMKAPRASTRLAQETDRNPNLHAIQAHDHSCHHRCNEAIAQAHASNHAQAIRSQQVAQPAFTNRF